MGVFFFFSSSPPFFGLVCIVYTLDAFLVLLIQLLLHINKKEAKNRNSNFKAIEDRNCGANTHPFHLLSLCL